MSIYLGVDVGTGSARAGLFDADGRLLGSTSRPIKTRRSGEDFVEQSSDNIWSAICDCVRSVCKQTATDPGAIQGIGFDATCSLVVVGPAGEPVTVSPSGEDEWDVIVWMDHRALADADAINALSLERSGNVLDYVGGVISPEMEVPKLRWLKRELPQSWQKAEAFFDLPDWLVFKATGQATRSLCSTVCKWTYLGQKGTSGEGWSADFFDAVGLSDLAKDGFRAIGERFAAPGTAIGTLSSDAARQLGLQDGVAVAASLIDAYSGALGTLGVAIEQGPIEERMALIAGTSSCHITVTEEPTFVPGIWGPYYSVLLPGLWANEAGQSAAGALIDRIMEGHGATEEARRLAAENGTSLFAYLDHRLDAMAKGEDTALLTTARHVQPDFHGNRAPLADPTRKGAIVGLSLDRDIDDLALDYLATLQALAYGTRHIIADMRARNVRVETLVVSGGLAQNPLFLREHADATGCRIIVPHQAEPVLAGSAMLGAVAAGAFSSLREAMQAMSGSGTVIEPRKGAIADFHDRKYRVFRRMHDDFAAYASIMAE